MKPLLTFAAALCAAAIAHAAGPIRVLYYDADGTEQTKLGPLHGAMRDLGRDAIWFDYATGPTPDGAQLRHYDTLILRPKADGSPALNTTIKLPNGNLIPVVKIEDKATPGQMREAVLKSLPAARRGEWEAFLAQREPEKRNPDPNVANYERRPEAITFQHPFSVKGSKERTQVPADMSLELFASEPDIAKPIAFAWDERGRLWVCEARDYPHGVNADGIGNDDIKICEDTDGDGKADKFTIFADKLNLPTSLVFANGGIIVSQPPRMLFLKDTNGDDKADVRQEIMTGWGIGDTHAQANNLHYGHDNWLYGCVGYSGFSGEVGGVKKQFAMGTFRFKADGSALEFLHQFSNNSWAHSANDAGDQFGGTANGAPIFYGGIPAPVVPKGVRATTARKINVVDICHTITPNYRQVDVFNGYTAAAGSAFIYSANMPPRLQGMSMICEPTMKTVSLVKVQPKGAGYTALDAYNLVASSDEWMSPVFAEVGPDGAVWFADWQNFIIQHNPTPSVQRGGYDAKTGPGGAHVNPLRDNKRGRIYRVVWENAKKSAPLNLASASTDTLVKTLSHDNPLWRLHAQRLLVEGKRAEAASSLKTIATNSASGIAAAHALWTLHGLGALDDATHTAALLSGDARVRRNATRALGADDRAKKLFFSAGVISDPDAITRCAAILKVSEFATTKEIQTIASTLAKNPALKADEWLNDAVRVCVKKHKADNYKEGPNLLPNPDFEITGADGLPEGWKRRDYGGRAANREAAWTVVHGDNDVHGGKNAVRCVTRGDADTSLYADVTLKPNTQYRLSGWVKARGVRGKISLNDHINRHETDRVSRNADWSLVEVEYNSGNSTRASINILHVAGGEGFWDDVKLCELLPAEDASAKLTPGDSTRGKDLFYNHTVRCVLCHMVKNEGSTVGPALDGIATRKDAAYIRESLLEPSKVLTEGYKPAEGTLSPMPPMGDIFTPQEIEDIQAFLQTLK
jgi:putative membrane-bound dehydrogenase-like protein